MILADRLDFGGGGHGFNLTWNNDVYQALQADTDNCQTYCLSVCGGRPSLVTAAITKIIEQQMRLDDETTAYQLHALLNVNGYPCLCGPF